MYWEQWQNHPNNDFEHFKLICELWHTVLYPRVIVAERNGRPCTLLLGRVEQTEFHGKIGYLKVAKVSARALKIVHEGLIGDTDGEIVESMLQNTWDALKSREADVVVFEHVKEGSSVFRALFDDKLAPLRGCKPIWTLHWEMEVPGEPGATLKKMKSLNRRRVRRKLEALSTDHTGRICWRWLDGADNLPQLLERLEPVAARNYLRKIGAGFVNDREHQERFALFGGRDQFRVQTLEIDDSVRAFWIGVVYGQVFYSLETAYDQELEDYSPGTLVLLRVIDELSREGVRRIDFGFGDAHYKRRFSDRSRREASLFLYASTVKGLILRSVLSFVAVVDHVVRTVGRRTGSLDRIKAVWRTRMRSKT